MFGIKKQEAKVFIVEEPQQEKKKEELLDFKPKIENEFESFATQIAAKLTPLDVHSLPLSPLFLPALIIISDKFPLPIFCEDTHKTTCHKFG
jgi:hypothetical protein